MGLVVLRGAIRGEMAAGVAEEAIMTLIVFLGIGAISGAITDYLIRDAVENLYRKRVQWYRDGVEKMNSESNAASDESTTN
jgi:hypothetical protein